MTDDEIKTRSRIILRSLAIWLVLICAEIVHGILRELFLVRLVGHFRSNQIGVFTGSAIIIAIAYLTIRWIGAKQTSDFLFLGAIWLVMTVAFEVLFGRFVIRLPWEELLEGYNIAEGGLMPFGLLVLLFSPLIATKLQGNWNP